MLLGYHYGPVEDIELVWTISAFVGLVFSLLNLRDAIGDMQFVRRKRIANGRKTIASANCLTEGLRSIIQLIFLIIGLLALTINTPPGLVGDVPWNILAINIAIRWGLIISSLLLTVKTIVARRVRKIVLESNGY